MKTEMKLSDYDENEDLVDYNLKILEEQMDHMELSCSIYDELGALSDELSSLRTKLSDPLGMMHFVANCFESLPSIIREDPDIAAVYAESLGQYARQVMETQNKGTVYFLEELSTIKAYAKCIKIIYPKLEFKYECREASFFVPNLSIQTLVENAVKHAFPGPDKCGTIQICSYREEEHNVIEVTDDGGGFARDALPGLGYRHIKDRIEGLGGRLFVFTGADAAGVRVVVKLPANWEDRE